MINPCEFVTCRNVKLSEETLSRHYNMLLLITESYLDHMFFGTALPRITDLYKAIGISSRAGDKILDRLECCWRYIICERSQRNRYKCYPTYMGLIAIYSKPEYYNKLREYLLTHHCKDPSDNECIRILDEFALYDDRHKLILSLFKNVDDLKALIDDLRTSILNNEVFRNAVNEYLAGFLSNEEVRKRLITQLRLPSTASTSDIVNKLLDSLVNDDVARAEMDIVIFRWLMRALPLIADTYLISLLWA